jgi:SpoVK/Ycf46/Vps4 family AAA+-type ATPase
VWLLACFVRCPFAPLSTNHCTTTLAHTLARPDSIDPALRRPGRFDREVHVNLPSRADRELILGVLTARWAPRPPPRLLQQLAAATEGWAGGWVFAGEGAVGKALVLDHLAAATHTAALSVAAGPTADTTPGQVPTCSRCQARP